MSFTEVYVVTGANKGIGHAIVKGLAQQLYGAVIYLTARNPSLGEAALKTAVEDLGDKRHSEIVFHRLDITNEQSCSTFREFLKAKHGTITALINNAGFAFTNNAKESPGEQADATIEINYYGTKLVSKYLLPLIRDHGRVVNIASTMGIMKGYYRDDLIEQFKNPNFTIEDVDSFVEKYKKAAHQDSRKANGFPESAYRVSKAAVIALSLVQQRDAASKNIIVNACCPGYVDTDMSGHKGPLTVEQGADTPIYLALDPNVPKGEFVYKRKVVEWL